MAVTVKVKETSGPRLEIGQELAPDTLQTFPTRTPFMYMSIWLYVGRFPELPGLKETVAVPALILAVTFEGDVGFEYTIGGTIMTHADCPVEFVVEPEGHGVGADEPVTETYDPIGAATSDAAPTNAT